MLLLLQAPAQLYVRYVIGVAPFVLALLYFITDMSHGVRAQERCVGYALLLTVLYVWKRCWQSAFCAGLHDLIEGRTPVPVRVRDLVSSAVSQLQWAPLLLLLMPAAVVIMLPLGWLFALYQNLTACPATDPDATPGRAVLSQARAMAMVWPLQNHLLLFQVTLLACFVFFNVYSVLVFLPMLLKSTLGIHTPFTRYLYWVFDTTFIGLCLSLTYLLVDPLVKAVYTLRCFYIQCIETGHDLTLMLQAVKRAGRDGVWTVLLLLACCAPAAAAENATPSDLLLPHGERLAQPVAIEPEMLQKSIRQVASRPVFAWRMDRDAVPAPDREHKHFLARMVDNLRAFLKTQMGNVRILLRNLLNWMDQLFRGDTDQQEPEMATGMSWTRWIRLLSWLLLLVLVPMAVWLALRAWRLGQWRKALVEPEQATVPDLDDESVLADQWPDEVWIRLGHRLSAQGDGRKAVRAYFMATLAFLGRCAWIRIVKAKSNREYGCELARRTGDQPDIHTCFNDQVRIFERTWYGAHPATDGELKNCVERLNELRALCPQKD